MLRAIELALQAEREGNLPVGAVISIDGEIIAEGKNSMWTPEFDLTRHAEIEALRSVSGELWQSPEAMTLHTTLQPCLMSFSSLLQHQIGRVVFGSEDNFAGAGSDPNICLPFSIFKSRGRIGWVLSCLASAIHYMSASGN